MSMTSPSRPDRRRARRGTLLAAAAVVLGAWLTATPATAAAPTSNTTLTAAASCSDVEVLFARGTLEPQGLGIVGGPFVSALAADLPGKSVSSYAVVYAADVFQTSGARGSADLVNHLSATAAACPSTKFVLGGYSQGATVVDKALSIRTLTGGAGGTPIPAALSSRVVGIAVFGNPLGLQRQTIATASPVYGPRSRDYCNFGDPVCGAGANPVAHLTYASNGSVDAGAQFVADLVDAS